MGGSGWVKSRAASVVSSYQLPYVGKGKEKKKRKGKFGRKRGEIPATHDSIICF